MHLLSTQLSAPDGFKHTKVSIVQQRSNIAFCPARKASADIRLRDYHCKISNNKKVRSFLIFFIIFRNQFTARTFFYHSILTFQWLPFTRRTAARKLSSRTRKVGKIGASLDSRLMYWIPILYFSPFLPLAPLWNQIPCEVNFIKMYLKHCYNPVSFRLYHFYFV